MRSDYKEENMKCSEYPVKSLGEFYQTLKDLRRAFWRENCNACPLSQEDKTHTKGCNGIYEDADITSLPMWFRGHERQDWILLPSLLRSRSRNQSDTSREQAFRVPYLTQAPMITSYDWTAMRQHHGMATRNLDWSECAMTALKFALKPFLEPDRKGSMDQKHSRENCEPVVWVLNPAVLNSSVYNKLRDLTVDTDREIAELLRASDKKGEAKAEAKEKYFSDAFCEAPYINGLFNLSVLNTKRVELGPELRDQVNKGHYSPFYWLLVQHYCDNVPIKKKWGVPPLAILPPYHSARIYAQRGVFTAFPSYEANDGTRLSDFADFAMELHGSKYLTKVILLNKEEIADQLRQSGERFSWLFPDDLDGCSRELELGG